MKEVLEYDVLVIGGGPAGSTAARFAARNGAKTLVIEKRQEIGSPVRCGEGISVSWLDEVEIEDHKRWSVAEVDGARLYFPGAQMFELKGKYDVHGLGVISDRDRFDKEMARLAAEEGAEFMLKTYATSLIIEDGKVCGAMASSMGKEFEIRAPMVIGADGFESQVGRWAGIYDAVAPKDIMSCFQYRMAGIDFDPGFSHFYLGKVAPGGYVWVFPKGNDTANVGLGIQLTRLDGTKTPKDYLDEFIESHEEIRKGEIIDMVAGAVSVGHPIKNVTGDGIMLVGDAARVVNPMTGGGIDNGVRQAKIAGEVAAKCVKEERFDHDFLKEHYEGPWRDLLENALWRNYMARERSGKMPGGTFAKLMNTLSKMDLEEVSVGAILKAIKKEHPDIVEKFKDMI